MIELTRFEQSYIETMVWSSTDDKGHNFDGAEYYDVEFADETLQKIRKDCDSFVAQSNIICEHMVTRLHSEQVAHDFWLTRNRHGAGFWDGDYPKDIGEALTNLAHSFGEQDLYVGDDGKFYLA